LLTVLTPAKDPRAGNEKAYKIVNLRFFCGRFIKLRTPTKEREFPVYEVKIEHIMLSSQKIATVLSTAHHIFEKTFS
jgi:hypothetical protein